MIVFEKCDPDSQAEGFCKSDEEINDWITSKYILTFENQKRFIQHQFDEQSLYEEGKLTWQIMTADTRTDYVK